MSQKVKYRFHRQKKKKDCNAGHYIGICPLNFILSALLTAVGYFFPAILNYYRQMANGGRQSETQKE